MNDPSRVVGLFVPPGSALGAAVEAALLVRGWAVQVLHDVAGVETSTSVRVILIPEDEGDTSWHAEAVVSRNAAKRWICLGSLTTAARRLAALARLGVVVLNRDVPFLRLLSHVEHVLAETRRLPPRSDLAVVIERRAAEAGALTHLTKRERSVLCHLMRGMTVPEIATSTARSPQTIRSQVQSLLRRLGASSQIEAVAIGHRSGANTSIGPCLQELHQY